MNFAAVLWSFAPSRPKSCYLSAARPTKDDTLSPFDGLIKITMPAPYGKPAAAFAVTVFLLLLPQTTKADFDLFGLSKPQTQQQPAPPPVRAAPAPTPAKPAAQNRVNPVRRKGKEGLEEAKIDADQARELYIRRKLRLEQIQAQQKELTQDKRTLAANRARMHARLIETARALRLSEKRLTEIEQRLSETRIKVKERREKLEDKSAQMSELFILMQGMSRQPPPVIITHSRDALAMIRSGMILATFYGDIERLASQLAGEVAELEAIEKDAELQEQRRRAEQSQNSRLKAQIDLLLIENRDQLAATASNLDNLKTATQINLAGIKSLEEMMPMLDAEVGKRSSLAAYEAEIKKGAAASPVNSTQVASLQPGGMTPSIPFSRAQGLLPLPVQGKMLIKFGQTDQYGAASKGIHLEARPGAQVISPCDGWIIYAGPFRSYGQLLIINTGGGYHVVMAGMDRIQAMQGQFVLAGEPVAVMGSETRPAGNSPVRPTLYVEFRKDQQSIDPAPWWSAGAGKG
jgi:septal ring factor EnvC (AmiA/AmiB activator)